MNRITVNSRVKHKKYGEGTVIQENSKMAVVLFDDGASRAFEMESFFVSDYFIIEEESFDDIKIEKISVKNLFDRLNYDIGINSLNKVAIFTAPNGCGKTTIFKLLEYIFNPTFKKFQDIQAIPFDEFSCSLSNGYVIQLRQDRNRKSDSSKKRSYRMSALLEAGADLIFEIFDFDNQVEKISLYDSISAHLKEGVSGFYYEDEDDRYMTGLGRMSYVFSSKIETALRKHRCKVNIDFIGANRLQKIYDSSSKRNGTARGYQEGSREHIRGEQVDFLKIASDEMMFNIKDWVDNYNRMLEEAKNKLPSMYLKANEAILDFRVFEERWNAYHNELEKFYRLGILKKTEAVIKQKELQTAYEEKATFLMTYLEAFEGTLEPLQKNYQKLKLFADIFHKRNEITHKTIQFTPNGIEIYSDGKKIDINCLSSGEKNDFVMFYRLIFNTKPNGIVLIDEPEISLHIEWQEEYLDCLIEICRINQLQAIVATHSPNIVNGHFDLFVDKR